MAYDLLPLLKSKVSSLQEVIDIGGILIHTFWQFAYNPCFAVKKSSLGYIIKLKFSILFTSLALIIILSSISASNVNLYQLCW